MVQGEKGRAEGGWREERESVWARERRKDQKVDGGRRGNESMIDGREMKV